MYDFSEFKQKIEKIKNHLKDELKSIQAGRANPAILDAVKAENYGVLSPINQMANIMVEDARTLRIVPFDPSNTKNIEKAIVDANLGLSVLVDEKGLRVVFPELTAERRQELVKLAKQKLEEARVALRQERDEVWSDIQEKASSGEITEDEKFVNKDQMEDLVKKANEELEGIFKDKEQDILGN